MADLIISTGMLPLRLLAASNNDTSTSDYNSTNYTSHENTTNSTTILECEDEDEEVDNFFSTYRYWGMAGAILILLMIFVCHWGFQEDNDDDENNNNNNNNNNRGATTRQAPAATTITEDTSYAAKIANMTAEERIHLYNEAFDKNNNQIVLTPAHIVVHDRKKEGGNDEWKQHDNSDGFDDDPSIYLALEDARSHRRSTRLGQAKRGSCSTDTNNDNNDNVQPPEQRTKRRSRKSSVIHPRGSIVSDGGGGRDGSDRPSTNTTTNAPNTIVHGDCVICFEHMEPGDLIAWSESKSCPHVYHKVS